MAENNEYTVAQHDIYCRIEKLLLAIIWVSRRQPKSCVYLSESMVVLSTYIGIVIMMIGKLTLALIKAEYGADRQRINVCPAVLTHTAPVAVEAHLNAPSMVAGPSRQTQVSVAAVGGCGVG